MQLLFGQNRYFIIFALSKTNNGSVVQLVRMPPCHGGGREFESRPVRKIPTAMWGFLF